MAFLWFLHVMMFAIVQTFNELAGITPCTDTTEGKEKIGLRNKYLTRIYSYAKVLALFNQEC